MERGGSRNVIEVLEGEVVRRWGGSVMGRACEAEGQYGYGVGRGQCERGRRPSWGCLYQLKSFSYQLVISKYC